MQLILDTTTDPRFPTLKLIGHIALPDIEAFDATLTGIVQTSEIKCCLMDCTALEAWDDAAIASLINFVRELDREDRKVVVVGLAPTLVANLERMGIAAMLPRADTHAEAINSLTAAS